MILETERLTLSPLVQADAERLYPLMSDPVVMDYWETREVEDPEVVAALVAERIADSQTGAGACWAVSLASDGGFIGVCELSEIDRKKRRAWLAVLLGREAWGRGYGMEAMQAVIGQAAALRLRHLSARTHVGDLRSQQMLQRLGFTEEAYLRGQIDREGERRDGRLWALDL